MNNEQKPPTEKEILENELCREMIYSIIVPNTNHFTYDELEKLFKDALNTVAIDIGVEL